MTKTNDKENKNKFYRLIDKKTGVILNSNKVTYSIPIKDFPVNLWDEWNKDCKAIYNDTRWQKVWTDHLKAKAYDALVNTAVSVVSSQLPNNPAYDISQGEETKQEDKEEVIPMIGDGETN